MLKAMISKREEGRIEITAHIGIDQGLLRKP